MFKKSILIASLLSGFINAGSLQQNIKRELGVAIAKNDVNKLLETVRQAIDSGVENKILRKMISKAIQKKLVDGINSNNINEVEQLFRQVGIKEKEIDRLLSKVRIASQEDVFIAMPEEDSDGPDEVTLEPDIIDYGGTIDESVVVSNPSSESPKSSIYMKRAAYLAGALTVLYTVHLVDNQFNDNEYTNQFWKFVEPYSEQLPSLFKSEPTKQDRLKSPSKAPIRVKR